MFFYAQVEHSEERYAILQSTSDSFKKEAAALEEKCKTITEALNKVRVEAETFKQVHHPWFSIPWLYPDKDGLPCVCV